MANEKRPEGRSYTGIELESTYGSAPSPDVTFPADEVYMEDFAPVRDYEELARTGESPYRQGWRGVQGKGDFGFTCKTEFTGLGVSGSSSEPRIFDLLRACGFGAFTYAAGPPKTVVTTLGSYGAVGVSVVHREEDQDGAGGTAWTYRGVRASAKIMFPLNNRITLDVTAKAKSLAVADYSTSIPQLVYYDTESECRLPLVNKGVTFTMATLEGSPVTYGGKFISGEIDLNMGLTVAGSAEGADGIDEVLLVPDGDIQGSLVVTAVPVADFEPWVKRLAGTPVRITLVVPARDSATDTVTFDWYAKITQITQGPQDKRQTWTLQFMGVYPETGRDDDEPETAGCVPANNLQITWSDGSS